jgi:molybdate transport system substrate-binding protein
MTSALANVVSEETDVRGVLAKVALGEADAGFVYVTDARTAAAQVAQVRIPAWAQPRVRYELAIVKATRHLTAARAFVRRVLSKPGRAKLKAAGFGLP